MVIDGQGSARVRKGSCEECKGMERTRVLIRVRMCTYALVCVFVER